MILSLAALGAPAWGSVDTPALGAYAQARLADENGALALALNGYRKALTADPGSLVVALRSYRQAIEAGDMPLALRAAHTLDAAGALPRDGTLLFVVDALARSDWAGGRQLAARLEQEENFAFLSPILRSWISTASGPYAAPQVDQGARFASLTARYIDEHVALQALGAGDIARAEPAIDRTLALRTNPLAGFRILAATRIAALGQRDKALSYLPPDVPLFHALRSQIASGARIVATPLSPRQGFARLIARIADDISSQDSRAIALVLGRIASFADPASAELRLALARHLVHANLPLAAQDEASRIPPASLFHLAAQDQQVDALMAADRKDAALALARQLAARPDTGSAQYMRLGNILADRTAYAEAAEAYRTAQGFFPEKERPWSLYLLEGSALERAGRWEEGRAALSKAAALAPNEPVVLNYLGYAQVERRQNVKEALTLLKKASALRPDDPSITDSLGWAHFISGDAKSAVPVLERAAAGAPEDVTINEHLGDALWAVGRRYEARYAWSAAQVFAEGAGADRLRAKVDGGFRPEHAAP